MDKVWRPKQNKFMSEKTLHLRLSARHPTSSFGHNCLFLFASLSSAEASRPCAGLSERSVTFVSSKFPSCTSQHPLQLRLCCLEEVQLALGSSARFAAHVRDRRWLYFCDLRRVFACGIRVGSGATCVAARTFQTRDGILF